MEDKINIIICTGTHCFVMGGSDLLMLEDYLPEEFKERVVIEGSNCLEVCEDRSKGKAPFVMINGELVDQASVPKILKAIDSLINHANA